MSAVSRHRVNALRRIAIKAVFRATIKVEMKAIIKSYVGELRLILELMVELRAPVN